MSDWALGKKLNSQIKDTPLDKLIYKNIVYTIINDLRTYGETSCFYESMSEDDRSRLYKMESFVNSATVRDSIIKQALLDNSHLNMSSSLQQSSMISFLTSSNVSYANNNKLLGRLINLCAKIEKSDMFITDEIYTVSDLLNDDSAIATLFSYFNPNDTDNTSLSLLFNILRSLSPSTIHSKLASLGLITAITNGGNTCSYSGAGYLLGCEYVATGGSNYSIRTELTIDGTSYNYSNNLLIEFNSTVISKALVTSYSSLPSISTKMYILPKNS